MEKKQKLDLGMLDAVHGGTGDVPELDTDQEQRKIKAESFYCQCSGHGETMPNSRICSRCKKPLRL